MPAFSLDTEIPLPAQPLADYSWLQRSLFLSHLAAAAYRLPARFRELLRPLSDDVIYYDRDGAQGYWIETERDCIAVFRGTEPNDWNDWRADLDSERVPAPTGGYVHHGFWRETSDLWPLLLPRLQRVNKPLWITGHSLGGAIAVITAARCQEIVAPEWIGGLYTFGAPRAGSRRFARSVAFPHVRWVHNNDIVPQLPPAWMGFAHGGRRAYLDRHGRLRQWRGWERWLDRFHGWIAALRRLRFDGIGDHSIDRYADTIGGIVREYAPLSVVPVRLGAPRRRSVRRLPTRRAA